MDESNSIPENDDNKEIDVFHDAPDEFPFYETLSSSSSSSSSSYLTSSTIHQTHDSSQNPNLHSLTGHRLCRRSFSHRFRDETDSASGNDSEPISSISFNYRPIKGDFKRVDQKLVLENEKSDFSGVGIGSNSEGPDDSLFVGMEREKIIDKKLEDLVDGNENKNENENSDRVSDTFMGFDSTASKERRKRFIEKLDELADENDSSHGFGVNLNTEVKDNNFDLPSGEISSNSVTNSVNTEIRDLNSNSSLGFDYSASEERKKRFAKRLEQLKTRKENSELQTGHGLDEENRDNVAANSANDDDLANNESSSGFLLGLASLVIKLITLQLSLLFTLVTFPLKSIYSVYMFVVDPFQIAKQGKDFVRSRLFKIVGFVCQKFVSFAGEWLKDHKSILQLILRFGWGSLWATYVCIVLVSLLVSAFVFSGVLMRKLVDEPIQMKEALIFDYTKDSPVAFVPITSCPIEPRHVSFVGNSDVGKMGFPRVIPHNHKLQATVSLMLPESDYNRNLGMFQVRVDLLSANGLTLTSSRRSCMLHFKSPPIRMLLTIFKIAPLVTGYSSESQTLNINLRGLIEKDIPTACLRVMIEKRAEFRQGAGIPEIYNAFLALESELPLLKKLMWLWKRTLFIWLGLSLFIMQLLFALVCCRPLLLPRGGVRNGSAGNIAPQDNQAAQR